MKVKLKRSIIVAKRDGKVGDIVLLSDSEAMFLISRDLVEKYQGKDKAINEEVEKNSKK